LANNSHLIKIEKMKENFMKQIALYVSKYLSTRVVFALDLLICTLSSLLVTIPANYIIGEYLVGGRFVLLWTVAALVFSAVSAIIVKSYKIIIRHSTIRDLAGFPISVLYKDLMLGLCIFLMFPQIKLNSLFWLLCADFFINLSLLICVRMFMIILYDIFKSKIRERQNCRHILVYGTSDKSVSILQRFWDSSHYEIVGFLSGEHISRNFAISNLHVYNIGTEEQFASLTVDLSLGGILFATESDAKSEQDRLVQYATRLNLKILMVPSLDEIDGNNLVNYRIREVKIEDLLGREEIKCSLEEICERFTGRNVMVTGAAGSIGSELCRQLAGIGVEKLILFDNAETPLHNLRLDLEDKFPELEFVPIIGDVRDKNRLGFVFDKFRPNVVFHAAAYKHVPLMEENPCEAIRVNVIGSKHIADKCLEYGVDMMVMISTDKAVNPTNIMGCSKRLAEIYVQSLGLALENGNIQGRTKFVTTRFGNVLGSNGSVIPHFREQIERGGPVTVTDPRINRYFMTIPEACRLVMEASVISQGNQIVVFDMGDPVKIDDLAHRMIELAGFIPNQDIMITYTGLRPGEKLYEEVLSKKENTDPTRHDRIRVARVRMYDFEEATAIADQLEGLASGAKIPDMIRLMKKTVPEFKSNNSPFEEYDNE
jgi:FlaA1/EpsC-like NDP-sugar epimerase